MSVDDEINQLERALVLDPYCREHGERLFQLYQRQGRLIHFESQETLAKVAKYGVQLAKPISKWRKDLKSESYPDRYDAVRSLCKLGIALTPLLPELIEAFKIQHSETQYRLAFYRAFAATGPHIADYLPVIVSQFTDFSRSEDIRIELTKIFKNAGDASEGPLLNLMRSKDSYQRLDALRLIGELGIKSAAVFACLEKSLIDSEYRISLAALTSLYQLNKDWKRLCPIAISLLEKMTPILPDLNSVKLFRELGAEAWPAIEVMIRRKDHCPRFVRRMIAAEMGQIDFGSSENNERFQSFCAAEFS